MKNENNSYQDKRFPKSPGQLSGGAFIFPRALIAKFADTPPLYSALYLWLLGEARFKDGKKLKRGQLFTSIPLIQKAMSYKAGFRAIKPTYDEIRRALEWFTKTGMTASMKARSGQVVTISYYDYYQTFKNYGSHSESHNQHKTLYRERRKETNGRSSKLVLTEGKLEKDKNPASDSENKSEPGFPFDGAERFQVPVAEIRKSKKELQEKETD